MTDSVRLDAEPALLFAYGTLGPRRGAVCGLWSADAVRGQLFDLGPYPALVDWDNTAAGWVEGHVRALVPGELEAELDPYEGIDEGLFLRLLRTTRNGRRAWVYVYPHPLPQCARGPLTRWDGPPAACAGGAE